MKSFQHAISRFFQTASSQAELFCSGFLLLLSYPTDIRPLTLQDQYTFLRLERFWKDASIFSQDYLFPSSYLGEAQSQSERTGLIGINNTKELGKIENGDVPPAHRTIIRTIVCKAKLPVPLHSGELTTEHFRSHSLLGPGFAMIIFLVLHKNFYLSFLLYVVSAPDGKKDRRFPCTGFALLQVRHWPDLAHLNCLPRRFCCQLSTYPASAARNGNYHAFNCREWYEEGNSLLYFRL